MTTSVNPSNSFFLYIFLCLAVGIHRLIIRLNMTLSGLIIPKFDELNTIHRRAFLQNSLYTFPHMLTSL